MQKYKNYHLEMQTFLKFYLTLINSSLHRDKISWTEKEAMLTGISTITFWRFRASYLIFTKGFPAESISLLRGIFENILTMIALSKNIISIENAFIEIPPNINLSKKILVSKALREGTFKTNNKVKRIIIGDKSLLSRETKSFFETIFKVMHNSVHRSMTNIVAHVFPWYQGEKILLPLPSLKKDLLSAYANLSLYLAWIMINLLPKIDEKGIEKFTLLRNNYDLLNKSFSKILNKDKNKKFIEEFIKNI